MVVRKTRWKEKKFSFVRIISPYVDMRHENGQKISISPSLKAESELSRGQAQCLLEASSNLDPPFPCLDSLSIPVMVLKSILCWDRSQLGRSKACRVHKTGFSGWQLPFRSIVSRCKYPFLPKQLYQHLNAFLVGPSPNFLFSFKNKIRISEKKRISSITVYAHHTTFASGPRWECANVYWWNCNQHVQTPGCPACFHLTSFHILISIYWHEPHACHFLWPHSTPSYWHSSFTSCPPKTKCLDRP